MIEKILSGMKMQNQNNQISLKRDIKLLPLIFYGLGNIIGAGIYVLIGEISAISGYFMPLSFLSACIVVLFTALSYAELSSRFPLSAGVAVYANKAFNNKSLSILIGLLVAFSGMFSAATIIHGFNGYLSVFIGLPEFLTSFLVLFTLCSIAVWGITESVKFVAFLTLIEALGLFIIIYVGFEYLPNSKVSLTDFIPPVEFNVYYSIIVGAFLAFFAFTGFEDMVNIAEEVKEPHKTMPAAIIAALLITTVLYMLIAFLSVSVIPPEILSKSPAPLADIYEKATGKEPVVLGLIGMLAVINGALIQIIMASRIFYGMSSQGWILKTFKKLNPRTQTPIFSTVIATLIIYAFTLWLQLVTLAELTSLFIFFVFTIVNISLIKIKLTMPATKETFCVPIWIPVISIILNLIMLSTQVIKFF